jgi:drug/metabolite transporter (DMT)-like permease
LSPSVAGYGLAASAVNGAVFGAVYRLQGGGPVRGALAAHAGVATFGAAAATTSYLLILWVWGRSPVAVGAALRDTSIVFAALIAVVVLKERLSRPLVVAVVLVAMGAGCLRFA